MFAAHANKNQKQKKIQPKLSPDKPELSTFYASDNILCSKQACLL